MNDFLRDFTVVTCPDEPVAQLLLLSLVLAGHETYYVFHPKFRAPLERYARPHHLVLTQCDGRNTELHAKHIFDLLSR